MMENTVSERKKAWFLGFLSDAQSGTLTLSLFYIAQPLLALQSMLYKAAAWNSGPSQKTPIRIVRDTPRVFHLRQEGLQLL